MSKFAPESAYAKEAKSSKVKTTIDKRTPHLFMWLTDGNCRESSKMVIGENQLPLPNSGRFDYYSRLKQECGKLKKTNTVVYLAYMGRMLTAGQRARMEALAHEKGFENLIVIDYDQVEKEMLDVEGFYAKRNDNSPKDKFSEKIPVKVSRERIWDMIGSIATSFVTGHKEEIEYLIDSIRLILMYNSGLIKKLSASKYSSSSKKNLIDASSTGILYRDFDVTLKLEEMPDLEVSRGYVTSSNYDQNARKVYDKMIKERPDLKEEIAAFFNKLYSIPSHKMVAIFTEYAKTLDEDDNYVISQDCRDIEGGVGNLIKYFEEFLGEFRHSKPENPFSLTREVLQLQKTSLFYQHFIRDVLMENSLLAVNVDGADILANAICEVFRSAPPHPLLTSSGLVFHPYGAVVRHFKSNPWTFDASHLSPEDLVYSLLPEQYFLVGNDYSWSTNIGLIKYVDGAERKGEGGAVLEKKKKDLSIKKVGSEEDIADHSAEETTKLPSPSVSSSISNPDVSSLKPTGLGGQKNDGSCTIL